LKSETNPEPTSSTHKYNIWALPSIQSISDAITGPTAPALTLQNQQLILPKISTLHQSIDGAADEDTVMVNTGITPSLSNFAVTFQAQPEPLKSAISQRQLLTRNSGEGVVMTSVEPQQDSTLSIEVSEAVLVGDKTAIKVEPRESPAPPATASWEEATGDDFGVTLQSISNKPETDPNQIAQSAEFFNVDTMTEVETPSTQSSPFSLQKEALVVPKAEEMPEIFGLSTTTTKEGNPAPPTFKEETPPLSDEAKVKPIPTFHSHTANQINPNLAQQTFQENKLPSEIDTKEPPKLESSGFTNIASEEQIFISPMLVPVKVSKAVRSPTPPMSNPILMTPESITTPHISPILGPRVSKPQGALEAAKIEKTSNQFSLPTLPMSTEKGEPPMSTNGASNILKNKSKNEVKIAPSSTVEKSKVVIEIEESDSQARDVPLSKPTKEVHITSASFVLNTDNKSVDEVSIKPSTLKTKCGVPLEICEVGFQSFIYVPY